MTLTPTDFDVAFGDLAQGMIAESGRSLLLRQPTRVGSYTGTDAGAVQSSPLSASGFRLSGFHAQGATAITGSATDLSGLLLEGDLLTIEGEVYTVSGGPYAPVAGVLEDVSISPGLLTSAPNNTGVDVEFSGTFTAIKGVVTQVSNALIAAGVARVGDVAVLVSRVALEAAGVTITVGDELHLGATESDQLAVIEAVRPIPSGEYDAAMTLIARIR